MPCSGGDLGSDTNGGCRTPMSPLKKGPTPGPLLARMSLIFNSPAPKVNLVLPTNYIISLGTIADPSSRNSHTNSVSEPPRLPSSLVLPASRQLYVQPQLFPILRSSNTLPKPRGPISNPFRWNQCPQPVRPVAPTRFEFVLRRRGLISRAMGMLRLFR